MQTLRLAVTLACLAPAIALAQSSVTTIDLGDGIVISTDQSGRQATTVDLGAGLSTTTIQPGFGQPSPQFGIPPIHRGAVVPLPTR